MFVDVFEAICEANGIAPSRVLDNLGVTRSAYSRWTKGGSPSNETKKKIADYFGITVRELMSGETKKPAAEATGSMIELLEEFRDNPELKTLFSLSKKATPEELRQYIKVIKALRGAKATISRSCRGCLSSGIK